MEYLVMIVAFILASGFYSWGHWKGRRWQRMVDESHDHCNGMCGGDGCGCFSPGGHLYARDRRIVRHEIEIIRSTRQFGPQYIVDDHGRLFEVEYVPIAREVPVDLLKCSVCGNVAPRTLWCYECGSSLNQSAIYAVARELPPVHPAAEYPDPQDDQHGPYH